MSLQTERGGGLRVASTVYYRWGRKEQGILDIYKSKRSPLTPRGKIRYYYYLVLRIRIR